MIYNVLIADSFCLEDEFCIVKMYSQQNPAPLCI